MTDPVTLTLPEVAHLAGVQVETLRMWYRRGYLEADGGGGWRRYALKDAAAIIFYAHIVRTTKDHEIAKEAFPLFYGFLAEQADGLEDDGFWLFFYRSPKPTNAAQKAVAAMKEGLAGTAAELWLGCEITNSEDQTALLAREIVITGDFGDGSLMPTIIPVHTIWGKIALQLSAYVESKQQDGRK